MKKLAGNKLVSYKLVEELIPQEPEVSPDIMNEKTPRPSKLKGSTYKLTPTDGSSSSMYITINDIVLNEGTEYEEVRPFEIFINSKDVEHVQWVSALTRVMSAVFRKGGDVKFLIDEMEEVFDPRGGYFVGSKLMGSIVAHIGSILKEHMQSIGMVESGSSKKSKEYTVEKLTSTPSKTNEEPSNDFPESAVVCKKCKHKAAIMMDNCLTCLNCGDGKCG